MANPNNPSGLWAVKMMDGTPYHPHITLGYATGASGAIGLGDPLKYTGTNNATAIQGWDIGRLPEVAVADPGDGDPIWGVCVGVVPETADSTIYRVDSTVRLIEMDIRPNVIWRCQSNAGGTAFAVTDMGQHTSLATGSLSTVTGRSGWSIDTGIAPGVDPSDQVLLMGLSDMGPGKNAFGTYAWFDILINNHAFMQAADAGRSTGI